MSRRDKGKESEQGENEEEGKKEEGKGGEAISIHKRLLCAPSVLNWQRMQLTGWKKSK